MGINNCHKLFGALIALLCYVGTTSAWTIPADYALVPSSNGRYFQTLDKDPFFWQADTAWLLFTRLGFNDTQVYLKDRASKNFTVVLAVGFSQEGIDVTNQNGDLPFIDFNVLKPNEKYWSYVDSVVQLAWETYGIRIALVPAWGQYTHDSDDNPSYLNKSTSYGFGHFIGTRYPLLPKVIVPDTNPIWTNKTAVKDDYINGGVHPPYHFTDWSPDYDLLANGIVAGERAAIAIASRAPNATAKTHYPNSNTWWPLMTMHPTNQWFSGTPIALASSFFDDRDWLTFDISQSGHSDFPPNPPIPWWNCRRGWEPVSLMYGKRGKKRPALDNEAHYEHRYDNGNSSYFYWNSSDVRVGSWQSALSGAAGITYGADMVMQFYTPGRYSAPTDGLPNPWSTDIHLPGSSQMQYIAQFLRERTPNGLSSRVPAQELIVSAVGGDDQRITATRSADGVSWVVVYLPVSQAVEVDVGGLRGCDVKAQWYDPLDGSYTSTEYQQCEGQKVRSFTPPSAADHADWVLVLESS